MFCHGAKCRVPMVEFQVPSGPEDRLGRSLALQRLTPDSCHMTTDF
jgi:hypothetical protein